MQFLTEWYWILYISRAMPSCLNLKNIIKLITLLLDWHNNSMQIEFMYYK